VGAVAATVVVGVAAEGEEAAAPKAEGKR
jgi:hypothetical protein